MSKNIFRNFSLLLVLILGFLAVGLPLIEVQAQPPPTEIEDPLGGGSFTGLFVGIAIWVAGFVALLAALMIVIGGFQYMVSGGNEEKVASARKTIQWALIGLGVVGGSRGLLQVLLEILGVE